MMNKLVAIFLIVLGAFLVYWGYDEYHALSSQVSELVSGRPSNKSVMILAAGGISLMIGIVQLMKK